MTEIDLVWLINADLPTDVGGDRGFYPAVPGGPPSDPAVMARRLEAILSAVEPHAEGQVVVTLHTSPRYPDAFFGAAYLPFCRRLDEIGGCLALHPHEDRDDGFSHYNEIGHLRRVVADRMARAAALGLGVAAFRSGSFAFHPKLGPLLEEHGILLDLSALPGNRAGGVTLVWPASHAAAGYMPADSSGDRATGVVELPIGWDGEGSDLNRNYLFNERIDFAGLRRVWARILAGAARSGAPTAVNFLSHGFDLADPRWREKAARFLDHVAANGGRLADARALAGAWPPPSRREPPVRPAPRPCHRSARPPDHPHAPSPPKQKSHRHEISQDNQAHDLPGRGIRDPARQRPGHHERARH